MHSCSPGRDRTRLTLALALALALAGPARLAAQEVTLNLKGADIGALIATVAEVTGKNFVIDPRVKGKVTVISSTPMHDEDLYKVFLSILKVHGFAAVPSGEIIKIVPDANAKTDNIDTVTGRDPGTGDELITRVIEIRNVPASQLVPILRPLVPQQAHLAAYQPSNVLIISDRAANVARIARIIRRIDQSSTSEIDIIPLDHASAGEIVRIIQALEPASKKGEAPGSALKLVADERTNSVLISGDKQARLRLRALIAHLDTPLEAGGNTHVVYLRYADAEDLVGVLSGVSETIKKTAAGKAARGKGAAAKGRGRVQTVETSIQADKNMNALVITAAPDVLRSLKQVIRKLDVRRAQVLVEALIAEVSVTRSAELGIQWLFADPSTPVGSIEFSNASGPAISAVATAATSGDPAAASLGNGLSIGAIGGAINVFGRNFIDVGVLIKALGGDGNTNILSTPSLVTLDNEEAEIIIGQNVPFITGQFTTTGAANSATNPFQTIQRQDVGLTLRLKPQINEGSAIKLDIEQEVSSLESSAVGASDLITNKRSIKTTVIVEDGSMLVLGGLIDDQVRESVQKVPLLGDIPIFGNLFRSTKSSKDKRSLMVFLHPQILRDTVTQTAISSEKYNQFRAGQLMGSERGIRLMPGVARPRLPELEELMRKPEVPEAAGEAEAGETVDETDI